MREIRPRRCTLGKKPNPKTTVTRKRGGKAIKRHVKTIVRSSRVYPNKPFYKVLVFDEINGNYLDAFTTYLRDTIEETNEDLISMRQDWKTQKKTPEKVVVYGYEIIPKSTLPPSFTTNK